MACESARVYFVYVAEKKGKAFIIRPFMAECCNFEIIQEERG